MGTLTPTDLRARQNEILAAITKARPTYPLAASNLEWWLKASGKRRDIPLSEFDFRAADYGLSRFLLNTHRRVIALGAKSGISPSYS